MKYIPKISRSLKGSASMIKRCSSDKKSRNAFLLSIVFHPIILTVIWVVIQMRMPELEERLFIQVQTVPISREPLPRPLERVPYLPTIPNIPQPQPPIAMNSPTAIGATLPPVTLIVKHNVLNEKPPLILAEKNVPLPAASKFVNGIALFPSKSVPHGGLIASGNLYSYGRNPVQSGQSLEMESRIIHPHIGGFTQSDIALVKIAQHHLQNRNRDSIDIVFIVDASQSMRDDIEAVRDHLNHMASLLNAENLDFTVGIVAFRDQPGFSLLGWSFQVTPQTTSISDIKNALDDIHCRGNEKVSNALVRAVNEVKFRKGAERHFILVTDEYSEGAYSVKEVLKKMKQAEISVDVIGRNEPFQKLLAKCTGGIWLPISSLKE